MMHETPAKEVICRTIVGSPVVNVVVLRLTAADFISHIENRTLSEQWDLADVAQETKFMVNPKIVFQNERSISPASHVDTFGSIRVRFDVSSLANRYDRTGGHLALRLASTTTPPRTGLVVNTGCSSLPQAAGTTLAQDKGAVVVDTTG
jgi:hypothetical protein